MRSLHLAAPKHFVSPDGGNIVLGLTGHNAGPASSARAEIDVHRPLSRRAPLRVRRLVELWTRHFVLT
jgi:hypothetical protein